MFNEILCREWIVFPPSPLPRRSSSSLRCGILTSNVFGRRFLYIPSSCIHDTRRRISSALMCSCMWWSETLTSHNESMSILVGHGKRHGKPCRARLQGCQSQFQLNYGSRGGDNEVRQAVTLPEKMKMSKASLLECHRWDSLRGLRLSATSCNQMMLAWKIPFIAGFQGTEPSP